MNGETQISATTQTEKESLCDWVAGKLGGYGKASTCAESLIEAPADKADCLSGFPTCAVKVSVFQACIDKIIAAQATCTASALEGVMGDANCQTVGAAGCFD